MHVLDGLHASGEVELNVIRDSQITHAESLAMKRRSHIVIDECVTGSYHRNSLEGLAAACVVVNGVGPSSIAAEPFRYCAGDARNSPFVYTEPAGLQSTIESLIAKGPDRLAQMGQSNRTWMEQYWDFAPQWERFWAPVVRQALAAVTTRASGAGSSTFRA